MTFHLAPPEVWTFGVTTSTSLRIRSFQSLIFFGLPLRTAKTTTERVTMPSHLFCFHFALTSPALTRVVMSGSSESATMSAFRPERTARACSPDEPYDCSNETSLPLAVFWNFEMILAYASRGVE